MDEAQKARIRLEHWINHNCDHLKGYLEVSNSLDSIGLSLIGDKIRNAVEYIDKANDEFRKALEQLGASSPCAGPAVGCCCSQHSNEHGHSHSHEHCHGEHEGCHEHSHEHSHSHTHQHPHGGSGHRHD